MMTTKMKTRRRTEEEYFLSPPVVFSTVKNITWLFEYTMWFVDGTFKTTSTIFFQLFSILGDVKQAEVFSTVIEAANDLSIVNVPSIVMTDFEVSIINAAKEHF